jgi:hypothetical protein
MAVLLGGAVCLILEPSLGTQAALTGLGAALAVGLLHGLLRVANARLKIPDHLLAGLPGLGLSLALPAALVLVSCWLFMDRLPSMGLAMAAFMSLAMGANWLASAAPWAWAPRASALMIYLGSLLLPAATLFSLAPAASVWAAVAAVPAWHARRVMLQESASASVARALLSAAVFIFALVLVSGATMTAAMSLRTGGSL